MSISEIKPIRNFEKPPSEVPVLELHREREGDPLYDVWMKRAKGIGYQMETYFRRRDLVKSMNQEKLGIDPDLTDEANVIAKSTNSTHKRILQATRTGFAGNLAQSIMRVYPFGSLDFVAPVSLPREKVAGKLVDQILKIDELKNLIADGREFESFEEEARFLNSINLARYYLKNARELASYPTLEQLRKTRRGEDFDKGSLRFLESLRVGVETGNLLEIISGKPDKSLDSILVFNEFSKTPESQKAELIDALKRKLTFRGWLVFREGSALSQAEIEYYVDRVGFNTLFRLRFSHLMMGGNWMIYRSVPLDDRARISKDETFEAKVNRDQKLIDQLPLIAKAVYKKLSDDGLIDLDPVEFNSRAKESISIRWMREQGFLNSFVNNYNSELKKLIDAVLEIQKIDPTKLRQVDIKPSWTLAHLAWMSGVPESEARKLLKERGMPKQTFSTEEADVVLSMLEGASGSRKRKGH